MLESVSTDSIVVRRLRTSVLGDALDDLTDRLAEQGYARSTIRQYVYAGGHFAHWIRTRKIRPSAIAEDTVDRFLEHIARCHCGVPGQGRKHNSAALAHLTKLRRADGLIAPAPIPPKTAIDLGS